MRGAQERCDSRRSLIHVFGAAPLCCQSRLVHVLNVMFAVADSGWWSYLFCRGWRSACKRNSLLDAIPLNVDPNSSIWCVERQSLLSTTQCPRVNRTRNRPAIHPSRGRKRCHAAWRKEKGATGHGHGTSQNYMHEGNRLILVTAAGGTDLLAEQTSKNFECACRAPLQAVFAQRGGALLESCTRH